MKNIHSITLFLLMLSIISCSPLYYEASTHNVPMLEEKGDIKVGAGTNLAINKAEIQSSYSPISNVALMANYMLRTYHFKNLDDQISQMFEGGIGLYHNVNERVVLEAYGLIGKGTFDNSLYNYSNDNIESLTGNMTKYALQLSSGYRVGDLQLAITLKPTRMYFSNIKGDYSVNEVRLADVIESKERYNSLEHSFTLRYDYDESQVQFQMGRGGRRFNSNRSYLVSYFTFGVNLNLRKFSVKDKSNRTQ